MFLLNRFVAHGKIILNKITKYMYRANKVYGERYADSGRTNSGEQVDRTTEPERHPMW